MPENNLINMAHQVRAMRAAQKKYFELIGIARKTKTPADYAAATAVLIESKGIEKVVDNLLQEFFGEGKEVVNG